MTSTVVLFQFLSVVCCVEMTTIDREETSEKCSRVQFSVQKISRRVASRSSES